MIIMQGLPLDLHSVHYKYVLTLSMSHLVGRDEIRRESDESDRESLSRKNT